MGEALRKEDAEIRYTYADYKGWELKPGERYELIRGALHAMSAPNTHHQLISGEMFRQIATYLIGKPCKVIAAPFDVRLFYREDEKDDTVVQPDISIICDKEKRGPEGGRGAPDFVAEILSPSNTVFEMTEKLQLYKEAGVREYWVLNPKNKTLEAHFFEGGKKDGVYYGAADAFRMGIFPDLEIDLGAVFAGD